MIKSQDLKLSLKADRKSFVRSESINLKISLVNNSAYPIKVEDLILRNNSLHFYAKNNLGKKFSGSLQSPKTRDGLHFPPLRKKSMILLKPKARRTIDVDLLAILGELTEGEYNVKATYSSEGILFVKSKTVFIEILKSSPVYSKTFQDYLRSTSHPIRSTWINREEDGLHLFIMETSQYLPSDIRSNRRILQLDEIRTVYPSILASLEQDTEHLMWIQGDTIKVTYIIQHVLKDVKDIKLPFPSFKILEPPFTDENGTLYFVIVSKENDLTIFRLISCLIQGEVKTEEICRYSGVFTKYCIIFDEEPRLHMAWASESGEIFYTWFDLEKHVSGKDEPKVLVTGKPPILDLQISKGCEDDEGNLQLLLNFVNYESPQKLHSHLINLDSLKTVLHSFSSIPELEDFKLLQTVLDLDCRPHYLFQDNSGALWFRSFEGRDLLRATDEGEIYPDNVDYPVLLVSSNMSRNYGIYLRYIKDKSSFVHKKLESLI